MFNDITKISKKLGVRDNVCLRVVDLRTKKVVQEFIGHNTATSTILSGIVHFLAGDGILNQARFTLKDYIPQYMSLGTMGLCSQGYDADGLPTGIGNRDDPDDSGKIEAIKNYLSHIPGFGADGINPDYNNNRTAFGLGDPYTSSNLEGELISDSVLRVPITFRNIIPETDTEYPKSMDLILGGLVSANDLSSFMGENDYLFISEAGLWNNQFDDGDSENNGLLAAYRISPIASYENYTEYTDEELLSLYEELKTKILRVNSDQVVEIIWKIQLGCIEDLYVVLPEISTSDSVIEDFAIGQNSLTSDVTQDLPTSSTAEIS